MISYLRKLDLFSFVMAGCLPFIFLISWLFRNTQLPGNDAANYLMTSVSIYHHFTDQGFWHGIWSCYVERGWRPIFFPVLTVPFLIFSQGNLYVAFSSVAILCLAASVIYLYLFFRLKLNQVSAIIATNLIALLPLVQTQIVMFYAEAALFPCIIGGIYHLIKSDYLRNLRQVWGVIILFSLAIILRPVEAVTHLFFLFAFFLFMGWHRKLFSLKQILIVLALGVTALDILFLASIFQYIHLVPVNAADDEMINKKIEYLLVYGVSGFTIAALLLWSALFFRSILRIGCFLLLPLKGHTKTSALISTIFFIILFSTVWILPFASETFQWIYRTSLGDVASNTGSLSGSRFSWEVLHLYVWNEGVLAVTMLILIAISSIILLSKEQRRAILFSAPFIYLLLLAPFPLWEAFYTVQIAVRKLSIAFPALLMAMLLLGLQMGRGWLLRILAVSFLTVLFFIFSIQAIFLDTTRVLPSILFNTIGSFVPRPVIIQPNPHQQVIDFLNVQANRYKLNSIGLVINPGTSDARHYLEAEPIDPFLLSTMVVANKSNYAVSYPYFSHYGPESMTSLIKKYDALFLSDKLNDMSNSLNNIKGYTIKYSDEQNASLKVFYRLLLDFVKNNLAQTGWKVEKCIVIKSTHGDDYLGCMLLKAK